MFSDFTKEQQEAILSLEKAFEGYRVEYNSPMIGDVVKDFLFIVKDEGCSKS